VPDEDDRTAHPAQAIEDPEGHAGIVREAGLPIAAGENLRTVWEFKQYIDCCGVTFPESDVTNCGGVTPFMVWQIA
jgi:L-alanine-DL-glutamate epimerase-like enolase superfamily enzyme